MKIFYCYSVPLKSFLKERGIFPLDEEAKINPNSGKFYWEYKKGSILDKNLSIWKENKMKAIQLLKNK